MSALMSNNNKMGGGGKVESETDRITDLVVKVAAYVSNVLPRQLVEGTSVFMTDLALKYVKAEEDLQGFVADGKPEEGLTHSTVEVAFGKVKELVDIAELSNSATLVDELKLTEVLVSKTTSDKLLIKVLATMAGLHQTDFTRKKYPVWQLSKTVALLSERSQATLPDEEMDACEALDAILLTQPKSKAERALEDPMALLLMLVLPVFLDQKIDEMKLEEARVALTRLEVERAGNKVTGNPQLSPSKKVKAVLEAAAAKQGGNTLFEGDSGVRPSQGHRLFPEAGSDTGKAAGRVKSILPDEIRRLATAILQDAVSPKITEKKFGTLFAAYRRSEHFLPDVDWVDLIQEELLAMNHPNVVEGLVYLQDTPFSKLCLSAASPSTGQTLYQGTLEDFSDNVEIPVVLRLVEGMVHRGGDFTVANSYFAKLDSGGARART